MVRLTRTAWQRLTAWLELMFARRRQRGSEFTGTELEDET